MKTSFGRRPNEASWVLIMQQLDLYWKSSNGAKRKPWLAYFSSSPTAMKKRHSCKHRILRCTSQDWILGGGVGVSPVCVTPINVFILPHRMVVWSDRQLTWLATSVWSLGCVGPTVDSVTTFRPLHLFIYLFLTSSAIPTTAAKMHYPHSDECNDWMFLPQRRIWSDCCLRVIAMGWMNKLKQVFGSQDPLRINILKVTDLTWDQCWPFIK